MGKLIYKSYDGSDHVVQGEPGLTIMQIATSNAIPGIDAECGGVLSCATCHVYIDDEWLDRTGVPNETERTMLEFALEPRPNSRLSCQIKFSNDLDGIVVHIPESQ